MAHDIGQMFYYGDVPWHGLGKHLERPATVDEALKAGGLDWTVSLKPIVPAGEPDSTIGHRMAVVRDDRAPGTPGRVVGVVHPDFRPLQNRDGAELFDALLGEGSAIYHTGGYLRSGEVIWLLARLPMDLKVNGSDTVDTYLLFANSHDGSVPIDIRLTTVRVVCQNTLSLALGRNPAGKVFRRGHDGSLALLEAEARAFFSFALAQCTEAEALFNRLARARCDADAFKRFVAKLLPDPAKPATYGQSRSVRKAHDTRLENLQRTRGDLVEVFRAGIPGRGLEPVGENLWGAVNAVTGWVDHVQPVEGDRYAHLLLGSGDRLKAKALAQATSLATVAS